MEVVCLLEQTCRLMRPVQRILKAWSITKSFDRRLEGTWFGPLVLLGILVLYMMTYCRFNYSV